MDLTNIQRRVFASVREALSHEDRIDLVRQLATELRVDLPVTGGIKDGDTVQTDQGPATAVVLTPDSLLRRLSHGA